MNYFNEIKNYFLYFFFDRNIIINIYFFLNIAYRKLTYKFYRRFKIYYPKKIKKILNEINISTSSTISYPKENLPNYPLRIKLINDSAEINEDIWHKNFYDKEETMFVHRWNWLLLALTEENPVSLDWGNYTIRHYLNKMSPLPSGIKSESYTVGERISNTVIFYRERTGKWDKIPDDISQSILIMAKYLSENIEFYPNDLSGNHLINNGRAFVLCGHSTGTESLINLGREIITYSIEKLFDENGFLREGSSHYQFLVTRWLLEIRAVCEEKKDINTLKVLNRFLSKIIKACKFFIVKDRNDKIKIPIIGDISPDCKIEWIIEMINSPLFDLTNEFPTKELLSGWSKLFHNWKPIDNFKWDLCTDLEFNNKKNPIWQRHDYGKWALFTHNEIPKLSPIASHSHYDFCSFVLFYEGNEIIIDTGKKNYLDSLYGSYYTAHSSHSTISIDNFPPMLRSVEKIFPKNYKNNSLEIINEANDKCLKSIIIHNGFSRIRRIEKIHKRSFILYENEVEVIDELDGVGEHILEYFFQFSSKNINQSIESISENNNSQNLKEIYVDFNIEIEKNSLINQIYQKKPRLRSRLRSKNYGHEEKSYVVSDKVKIVLPTKIKYFISV